MCDFTFAGPSDSAAEVVETMRDLCVEHPDERCWSTYTDERVSVIEADPERFVDSEDWRDRVVVAMCGEPKLLARLAANEDTLAVASALASVRDCPAGALPRVIELAAEDAFLEDELLCLVADHPNLDEHVGQLLLDAGIDRRCENSGTRWEFLQVLAGNPAAPPQVLEDTVVMFPELVSYLRSNPACGDSPRLSLLCHLLESDPSYWNQPLRLGIDLNALLGS